MSVVRLLAASADPPELTAAFARGLGAHDAWRVPVQEGASGPALAMHDQALVACSSAEAWDAAPEPLGPLHTELAGARLLHSLPPGLATLHLDPGTLHARTITGRDLVTLRVWGRTLAIEDTLLGRDDPPDAFGLMVQHTWRVAVREHEGKTQWMRAPDAQGRTLAAIFTAPDTADAFVSQVQDQLGFTPEIARVDGGTLFRTLAEMALDGIVVNCSGPVATKAVAPAFSRVVLERGA